MSGRGRGQNKDKTGKNKGGNLTPKADDVLLEDILSNVSDQNSPKLKALAEELSAILLPAISVVITKAIDEKSVTKEAFELSKSNIRLNKYETDRLEQYTRRENVRIFNYAGVADESLEQSVVTLLNDMVAVDSDERFKVDDISVCHRLGKKQEGSVDTRPIIVRFVSRQKVQLVFRSKKNLKTLDKYKGGDRRKSVFITEDLTQLRLKLRDIVKNHTGVTGVYTREGIIYGTLNGRKFTVSNPDDLFKIGIDVELKDLNLENYE